MNDNRGRGYGEGRVERISSRASENYQRTEAREAFRRRLEEAFQRREDQLTNLYRIIERIDEQILITSSRRSSQSVYDRLENLRQKKMDLMNKCEKIRNERDEIREKIASTYRG